MTDGALDEIELVRTIYRQFAATALARLPLYRHLSERAAEDVEVAGRLLLADPGDRHPTLLFAAVHDHLLALEEATGPAAAVEAEPLCAWYPSVAPQPRPPGDGADDPWPHFRRLALDAPDVAEHLTTRGTQTNEVGRCATTLPALEVVQRDVEAPLALVEVGASAGLNLRLDDYGYGWSPDEGGEGDEAVAIGPDRPVQLRSRWRGPHRPALPSVHPIIEHRIGIDRAPVDVTDPEAVRWLIACQWPEQVERLDRCRAALGAAAADPPPVRRGDLLDSIGDLVREVPDGDHPVVLSTWVLAYLGVAGQQAFLAALDRVGSERDLTLVVQEEPTSAPGLDLPGRPDGRERPGPTALCRLDWRDGTRREPVRLADQHPHGTWLEWFGSP